MLAARRLLGQRAVEDHLAARGRSVEALFAFLHEQRLALDLIEQARAGIPRLAEIAPDTAQP